MCVVATMGCVSEGVVGLTHAESDAARRREASVRADMQVDAAPDMRLPDAAPDLGAPVDAALRVDAPAPADAQVDAAADAAPDVGAPPCAPALSCEGVVGEAGFEQVLDLAPNPALLRMFRYTPAGLAAGAPLVVVMHGCGQPVADARLAGWDALAEAYGFHVLYPEHPLLCWRWAIVADRTGERDSLLAMLDRMAADRDVDPARRYLAAFGAGGAQAMVVLAEAPGRFEAVATVAAVPYDCGRADLEAFCLLGQVDRAPEVWADEVRAAGGPGDPVPRLSTWHASADLNIGGGNQTELLEQWLTLHGIDGPNEACERDDTIVRRAWRDAGGRVAVEAWTIDTAAHGVFVDSASGCGAASANHPDIGVSFAAHAASFFGLGR